MLHPGISVAGGHLIHGGCFELTQSHLLMQSIFINQRIDRTGLFGDLGQGVTQADRLGTVDINKAATAHCPPVGSSIFQLELFWSRCLNPVFFRLNPASGSCSSPHYFYHILFIAHTFDCASYHRSNFIPMHVSRIDSFFFWGQLLVSCPWWHTWTVTAGNSHLLMGSCFWASTGWGKLKIFKTRSLPTRN